MKSLEIVNSLLEEKENECYKAYGIFLEKQIKELRKIQQDLEVLEIIRKKKVEVFPLWFDIKTLEEQGDMYILISYNRRFNNKLYELTMEELLKLKQWLEVNEE